MFKSIRSTGINFKTIINVINKYSHCLKSDEKIVNELSNLVKNPISLYTEEKNRERTLRKWGVLKNHIDIKVNALLDYGGNVGDTAYEYGKILGLTKNNIYVVDIDEWAGEKWIPRTDITFVHYNNMDKIPSNSIDLITIHHALHHIESNEFKKIIEMYNRVLTNDGIIVLYEHNSKMDDFATMIDLEHLLFDVVVSKKISYNNFIKTFYARYYTIKQWKHIFNKYFVDYFTLETYSSDKSFYLFMKRKK